MRVSRRDLLRGASAFGALVAVGGNVVISSREAWAVEATALKPSTVATLVQMARDIYPHDQVPDKHYAIAIKAQDAKAAKDPKVKALLETGVAALDKKAGKGGYAKLGWEEERVKHLQAIEKSPFFQAIRGDLVVSLYNQKEIWPIFGYEGESYSKGGYIARGFDDIEWL
ncbi:alpha-amylase/alpha-mannosidase (GH57 family) [Variibacter gotjawalensis]|nr:alpha-amylase/alpha-mannosidase (GH57 family) [Variibacter gotjawalensis]